MALERAARTAPLSTAAPPPPPPRTLNVQKFAESRAPELQALHSIVANRLNNDFRIRRDKRRRTTGHKSAKNRRPRKKKRIDGGAEPEKEEEEDNGEKEKRKLSRKARRKMDLRTNPVSGFLTAGDGTKRLRTHLWHAKRFTMVKRWGFYLPLGLHGRGKGSRGLLKRFKSGALIHDASYCLPMQLEGPEDSILAILRMVLMPSPSGLEDDPENPCNQIAHGVRYGNAMLYHVDAPLSKLIAPVIYMWRPLLRENDHIGTEQDVVSNDFGSSSKDRCTTLSRKLWIWIHAAAFDEGLDLLNNACQKQVQECGVTVRCSSLHGQIAKLDVMGSKAIEVLKKILLPVTGSCTASDHSVLNRSCDASSTNSCILKPDLLRYAEQFPCHGILSLTVHDPRESSSNETRLTSDDLSIRPDSVVKREDIQNSNVTCIEMPCKDNNMHLSMWPKPEINAVFGTESKSLWDCIDNLNPPIPEDALCEERHHRRLQAFCLESADNRVQAAVKDDLRRSCSILLLKHVEQETCHIGWSIILPLCWIKAFWIPLVSHGAHAIGLRERRWIASNCGLPFFPFDFPDCKAYSNLMADEASAFERMAKLRPLAMRPLKDPMPPPWHCIAVTIEKGQNFFTGSETYDAQTSVGVAPESPLLNSDPEIITSSLEYQASTSFPGFIPRTSQVLDWYVEKIGCSDMLSLFTIERVEKETLRCGNSILVNKELCFVRVLLHAYKEGAFEEGAIVFAPFSTDLSQWTSRSEEEEEHEMLQIPQPSVRSCFIEQDSGKWELQVPVDSSAMQTFRWPIGFVTTGFVRGSSKPTAVAFCEVKLLAVLKEQQLRETKTETPEIFLFVRNMKSTVYRRALARVVLGQQNEDVKFM